MDSDESTTKTPEAGDLDIHALLSRVAHAVSEIEQAKRERTAEQVRAARTHLAALHGVARLRRHAERLSDAG